jgi:uncharacterized membrane protein
LDCLNEEQIQNAMNFLILLILCLMIVGFALIALGIRFLLVHRQNPKGGSYKKQSMKDGKDIRCGCGRENYCTIEYAKD